jgi:ESS family glutamate:Na+ symporter
MTAVCVFVALSALLFLGKIIRMKLVFLQRLYLPSSVIGGLVGLALACAFGQYIPAEALADAQKVPGFLINIVFATLFLGASTPKIRDVVYYAMPQLCLGQLIAWGQYVVGLGLAGFLFVKVFGVPAAFGNLIEIGFEGGHGTVGGMVEGFVAFGWEDGIALGYTMATVGMILGIVIGMAMIQWAYRRGIVTQVVAFDDRSRHERKGVHLRRSRPAAGRQTVMSDSIDSLAWHLAVTGVAVMIGVGLHSALPIKGFPLFPLCMIGGVVLQWASKASKQDLLLDRGQMERISGASLDYLVVAAVATIQLRVVAENWIPLTILVLAGTAWSCAMVLCVAPRIFRKAWFERAIAEFGQAMGVTATGLLLLRTVDPESRTPAAMSFGYKQLLHEPFMGGGIWTALALALVYRIGWMATWLICVVMLLAWGAVAFFLWRRNLAIASGAIKAPQRPCRES